MKMKTPPVIVVRRLDNHYEYFIQSEKFRVHFMVDFATHETLKQAQRSAEMASQILESSPPTLQVLEG